LALVGFIALNLPAIKTASQPATPSASPAPGTTGSIEDRVQELSRVVKAHDETLQRMTEDLLRHSRALKQLQENDLRPGSKIPIPIREQPAAPTPAPAPSPSATTEPTDKIQSKIDDAVAKVRSDVRKEYEQHHARTKEALESFTKSRQEAKLLLELLEGDVQKSLSRIGLTDTKTTDLLLKLQRGLVSVKMSLEAEPALDQAVQPNEKDSPPKNR
jgi:hypothetical protein